ncbi:proline--tRNA ligase [Anaerobaca lacustris]|uniref:Proline--tRNA ligase n=1 Tax=Anaerobaca lacustris TaxID=3044600 RepID=A0AAW6TYU1_9BACT|nr:proline--tRNA ligase [Sedimentisphaerales bacterium M17dextr]
MRSSQMLIPTVKEVPADAEIPSHQLMLRAGLIRKVASGTYTYLPLGWRTLKKIIEIVREEMDRAGAQEILVPCLQPRELWQQTGRDADYGETMCRLQDRHGRWNVLGPTAEEVFTFHASHEINSYKQLPINLYQISPKFRDEFRPRFGVLRSREFMMKDAYSFDANPESLHKSYMAMYDAYCRVFKRCGVEYVIVEAETGEMGGSGSHQFTVPCASGEDTTVYTEDGSYAANLEKAAVDPLPKQPADPNIPAPEDVHTPHVGTIEAVCDFLKTKPSEMIKTLIYSVGDKAVAALVRGDHDVNAEKLTQVLGGAHSELADEATIQKVTGAKVGFAGPVGLAGKVSRLIVDHAVAAMAVGVTGANRSDYHTKNVVPGRDFPLDGDNVVVADVRNAVQGDTYQGKPLLFKRGIEVGQVFKLGTKYSRKLGATFLDEHGVEQPCLMGCYGIGINRIMASAIELYHDENGIVWPISIAPFEVLITPVNQDDAAVSEAAERIYTELKAAGIDVLLDDRDLRGGVKFKDADLIGIPVRITVGKKSVVEGNVEIKRRTETESRKTPIQEAARTVVELVESLKGQLRP